jgi:hypothetical protein
LRIGDDFSSVKAAGGKRRLRVETRRLRDSTNGERLCPATSGPDHGSIGVLKAEAGYQQMILKLGMSAFTEFSRFDSWNQPFSREDFNVGVPCDRDSSPS